MNKVQKNYIMAKATLQTYEEMLADIEKKYIAEIKSPAHAKLLLTHKKEPPFSSPFIK